MNGFDLAALDLQDQVLFTLGGVAVYQYGALLSVAALLCFLMTALRAKKVSALGVAAGTFAGLVFGLILSRLLYVFADETSRADFSFENIIHFTLGGFSMCGALIGASAGCALGAKLSGDRAADLLDALAPGLMLFVCIARLGEWGGSCIGYSRELENADGWLYNSFLAEDGYLRVYLLEAAAALLIMLLLLFLGSKRKSGFVFLRGMIVYGAVQTLLESLRHDGHMRFGFTGLQHILSFAFLFFAVIVLWVLYRRETGRSGRGIAAAAVVLIAAALCIVLEFFIDGNQAYIGLNVDNLDRRLIYALYTGLLALSAVWALAFASAAEKVYRARKNR